MSAVTLALLALLAGRLVPATPAPARTEPTTTTPAPTAPAAPSTTPAPAADAAAPPLPTDGGPRPAAAPRTAPLRMAVYDLGLEGAGPRVGRVVSEALVTELRKLDGVLVVSMEEVRAMLRLEADKQATGCGDDSCLAEIGDALGVDNLIVGQLVVASDGSLLSLRRIDQREARVVGTVSRRLATKNGEEFLAAVGPGVQELFPALPLRAGQRRGVDPQVALLLNPPPLPPALFWSTVAVGITAAAGAAGTLGVGLVARQELVDLADEPVIDGSGFVQKQQTTNTLGVAAAALGVGAALVAGVALMEWPLTDFDGYAARGGE